AGDGGGQLPAAPDRQVHVRGSHARLPRCRGRRRAGGRRARSAAGRQAVLTAFAACFSATWNQSGSMRFFRCGKTPSEGRIMAKQAASNKAASKPKAPAKKPAGKPSGKATASLAGAGPAIAKRSKDATPA